MKTKLQIYQMLILDDKTSKLECNLLKTNQISFAGRVTLTKSVLQAVPVYPMMTNILPKTCIEEIQYLQKRFIWGDTLEKQKYHVVNLDMLTNHREA